MANFETATTADGRALEYLVSGPPDGRTLLFQPGTPNSAALFRAIVEPAGTSLKLRTPSFALGDDVCCPSKILQRTYEWSATAKALHRTNSVEFVPTG